jgi:hypothetical protein
MDNIFLVLSFQIRITVDKGNPISSVTRCTNRFARIYISSGVGTTAQDCGAKRTTYRLQEGMQNLTLFIASPCCY